MFLTHLTAGGTAYYVIFAACCPPPERFQIPARVVAFGRRFNTPRCHVSDPQFSQEELEVPYEIAKHQRGADLLAPKELKDVHPLGTAPVVTDGDVTIAESGAIVGTDDPAAWTPVPRPHTSCG